jgi:hypothetical protein
MARTHYILQISMPGCRDHGHIVLDSFVLIQFPLALEDSSQQAPIDTIVAIQVRELGKYWREQEDYSTMVAPIR